MKLFFIFKVFTKPTEVSPIKAFKEGLRYIKKEKNKKIAEICAKKLGNVNVYFVTDLFHRDTVSTHAS